MRQGLGYYLPFCFFIGINFRTGQYPNYVIAGGIAHSSKFVGREGPDFTRIMPDRWVSDIPLCEAKFVLFRRIRERVRDLRC
jgi:hypothetical protein